MSCGGQCVGVYIILLVVLMIPILSVHTSGFSYVYTHPMLAAYRWITPYLSVVYVYGCSGYCLVCLFSFLFCVGVGVHIRIKCQARGGGSVFALLNVEKCLIFHLIAITMLGALVSTAYCILACSHSMCLFGHIMSGGLLSALLVC